MASEWLKFEVNTPNKREVLAMTVALGWDEAALTVGKLMMVWCWFDQHAVDGVDPELTMDLLDRIAGTSGFAQAMCNVGWLIEADGGLMLPNFDRHNGKSAKDRALTAKRNAKLRAKHDGDETEIAGSDGVSVTMPSPIKEKKIKEKKYINSKATTKTITATAATSTATANATEKATAASDDVFPPGIDFQIINDFKALRKKLHLPITKTALDGLQREGAKAGLSLEAVLKMCCERGWRGFKADWAIDDISRARSCDASGRPASREPKFDPVAYANRFRIDPS